MAGNTVSFINHEQLQRCLLLLWMADIPACIIGGVGCGKTMAVETMVKDVNRKNPGMDFNLWKIFLGLVDATEVGGIPFMDHETGKVVYSPPSTLPYNTDKAGIIFGDEYDRAPPDVQNAFNQILLGREIHGNKISKNAYVVLAMNGDSDRYTTPLSEAARNRVCTLFLSSNSSGNLECWDRWAEENNINPVIRAFAHCRSDLVEDHTTKFSELAITTPRSRDAAGRIMDAAETVQFKTADILVPCLAGVVGMGTAHELLEFKRIKEELPPIPEVIRNPEKYKDHELFKKNDLMYMLGIAIADHVGQHKDMAGEAISALKYLPLEIQAWAVRTIISKCPQAAATKEYIEHFENSIEFVV
jgi:hypothetical protein